MYLILIRIMAKDSERRTAKILFLDGKTQKEIASIVNVQEKTIGDWVKKFGWKTEREARFGSSKKQIENIRSIISAMAEDRFCIHNRIQKAKEDGNAIDIKSLQKEAAVIDDGVSKWNKTLENLDKENKISLATKIQVLENIFLELQNYDQKIFLKTLDFQEHYLTKIASTY